jgi:hypothetical protein
MVPESVSLHTCSELRLNIDTSTFGRCTFGSWPATPARLDVVDDGLRQIGGRTRPLLPGLKDVSQHVHFAAVQRSWSFDDPVEVYTARTRCTTIRRPLRRWVQHGSHLDGVNGSLHHRSLATLSGRHPVSAVAQSTSLC